jgi:hypothetical protein
MDKVRLTVTLDDAHVAETDKVAAALASQGFTVESTIPAAGAIFGSATEESMARLGGVEGVREVRRSGAVQLPPLDESIPQ